MERRAEIAGIRADDYEDDVVNHIGRLLSDCELRVRLLPESLLRVLQEGRFRTRFELDGLSDLAFRARFESELFSPYDSDPEVAEPRPRYGYLFDGATRSESLLTDMDAGEPYAHMLGYGWTVVVLESGVLDDTTFCFGDSMYAICGLTDILTPWLAPSEIFEPHWTCFDHRSPTQPQDMALLADFRDHEGKKPREYVEAQIHIVLEPADIRHVVFTRPFLDTEARLAEDLYRGLTQLGIPHDGWAVLGPALPSTSL